jgi:hypothetical protein
MVRRPAPSTKPSTRCFSGDVEENTRPPNGREWSYIFRFLTTIRIHPREKQLLDDRISSLHFFHEIYSTQDIHITSALLPNDTYTFSGGGHCSAPCGWCINIIPKQHNQSNHQKVSCLPGCNRKRPIPSRA